MSLVISIRTDRGDSSEIDLAGLRLPCVVGRDADYAQIVVDDSQISRAHCKLLPAEGGLAVEDLASRNGTWVNGQRVNKALLRPGDTLRIGTSRCVLDEVQDEPPDPLEGRRLGGFELVEAVGRGRYGTVYRAMQVALQRPVAIKVLSAECRSDPQVVESFLVEARRAGRLNHPNLVQVHDVVQIEGHYLLAMELMAQSAGDILREQGPFEAAQLIRLLREISQGLGYAESQRLVHRDVKPDNILVNDEGAFKLADLGIATAIADDGQARQERIFGSPHYVAPEQARGGSIDGRADLYALGASVWHLATGAPLFDGTSRQVIAAHLGTPIPDLRKLAPKLSPGLIELINRLLEKNPDRRPENAAAVVARLDQLGSAAVKPIKVFKKRMRRVRLNR
jgi:serine/threonine-protein kinase